MDLQQQGVTVLLELDKEARAHQVERQHRAILKFAGFCRAFPIPNLVNSGKAVLCEDSLRLDGATGTGEKQRTGEKNPCLINPF